MSYKQLYDFRQSQPTVINRNIIRDKVREVTGIELIKTAMTTLDINICRGFYLSARNVDSWLVRQHGSHVIVLARALNPCWSRFVFLKELMHTFDDPLEATDTGDKFENLLSEFGPGTPERSPQLTSEIEAFWMALGITCPEEKRLEFKAAKDAGQIDDYGIALKLKMPEQYVSNLFDPDYTEIIKMLFNQH